MASICKEILLDAAPANVWATISGVGAAHERLLPGDPGHRYQLRALSLRIGVVSQ